MKIAGIDPGTHRIGYALVEQKGSVITLIAAETITISEKTAAERFLALERALTKRFERDSPDALSIEKLFFAKNAKTAITVAEARGIILLTASRLIRSIWEYTPLEVKMATAGYGRADKSQMRRMVRASLPHAKLPPGDDAIDAIAIALTGAYTHRPEYISRKQ